MRRVVFAAGLAVALAAARADIVEHFESSTPGEMPGGVWSDIAGSIANPTVASPTGSIIETDGPGGALTRAFQISVARGTSQGIIAAITPRPAHRLSADLRIDRHPTPAYYADWNAAVGFIQDRGTAPDINQNPQAVVYVYRERWYFFGATDFFTNSVNIELGPAPVLTATWYRVELDADTLTGSFDISVLDPQGTVQVARTVKVPKWDPGLGAYNRVAAFDGDYSKRAIKSGQFTIDNVSYTPAPPGLLALAGAAVLARRSARRTVSRPAPAGRRG